MSNLYISVGGEINDILFYSILFYSPPPFPSAETSAMASPTYNIEALLPASNNILLYLSSKLYLLSPVSSPPFPSAETSAMASPTYDIGALLPASNYILLLSHSSKHPPSSLLSAPPPPPTPSLSRARILKLLWSPGINSKESITPAFVAWRAGTITLFLLGS